MTTARRQQISLEMTPYYHCVSRCVRRTFLCGYDSQSKRSYEHRRDWIEQRIKELSAIYCINICAYAVMSNHYHVVVHIDKPHAESLTDSEVIERWSELHTQPLIIQRYGKNALTCNAEIEAATEIITRWRERLYSLSWFMRELNFDIGMKANQEDNCKGHFWESRYKSQALLDENALLAAMAYVDLNPIRAGIATKLTSSQYTSIKDRLDALKQGQGTAPYLHPFIGNSKSETEKGLPFRLMDYLELVNWTGTVYRKQRREILGKAPSLLDHLNLPQQEWITACTQLEKRRALRIGSLKHLRLAAFKLNHRRVVGYQLS